MGEPKTHVAGMRGSRGQSGYKGRDVGREFVWASLRHAQVGPPAPHFPTGSRAQRRARSLVYTFRDGKCREPQHELMEDKEFHELFRQATILLPCAPQFCALRPRVP